MAIHELELDALAQTGEQRRPVSGKDRLHKELVLVDQSQICQRQGERHATHEQALAWLLLEPLNRLPQVALHQLGIPIDPAQRAALRLSSCPDSGPPSVHTGAEAWPS